MSDLRADEKAEISARPIALPARGPFEGAMNVVRFNWPLYVVGVLVAGAALFISTSAKLPFPARWALVAVSAGAFYLLASSLLVSHWIYDRSLLYRFDWAARFAGENVKRIVNLHSGFDESSLALKQRFPDAELIILDFYDPVRMTEASIARARRHQAQKGSSWLQSHTQPISAGTLPVADHSIDALFAILAVHEVRLPEDRTRLFAEIARVLRPGGRLLLVEHLRNPANFLAFGPQFVHFYSRHLWLDLARHAKLSLIHEARMTPFIGFFVFEKPALTISQN